MSENNSIDKNKHIQTYKEITLNDFITSINEIDADVMFRLPAEVTLQEFKKLVLLPVEVAVLEDEVGNSYIIKGKESEEENTVKILSAHRNLNIVKVSHTHIKSSDNSDEIRIFLEGLPSAADLASRKIGLSRGYIYNEFGRTTYTTYHMEAMGKLRQGIDEFGSTNMVERKINIVMTGEATQAAKKQNFTDLAETLNFIGAYMEDKMGCGFKFEKWEDIL